MQAKRKKTFLNFCILWFLKMFTTNLSVHQPFFFYHHQPYFQRCDPYTEQRPANYGGIKNYPHASGYIFEVHRGIAPFTAGVETGM